MYPAKILFVSAAKESLSWKHGLSVCLVCYVGDVISVLELEQEHKGGENALVNSGLQCFKCE